jgi:hypothetical protein
MVLDLIRSDPWGLGFLILRAVNDEFEKIIRSPTLHGEKKRKPVRNFWLFAF